MSTTEIKITTRDDLKCATFMPDGTLVVGDGSGAVRRWCAEDGLEVSGSAMQFDGVVYAAVASADGQWIVTSGSNALVIVWNAVTHQRAVEVRDHEVHPGHVCTVDVSGDSKRFATGSHDRTARIFDILSGTRLIPPLHHLEKVVGVKFSPDANRIATITHTHLSLGIYDTYSGKKLFEIPLGARRARVTPLAWSPDGQQLLAATPGKITCLDISTSSHSDWAIHDNDSQQVSIVTNGKFVACSAGSSVSFWDLASRAEIGRINLATVITCIAVSRDGIRLACGHCAELTIHKLSEFLPECYLPSVSCLPLMQMSGMVMKSWVLGRLAETESMLSEEIAQHFNPSHDTYAARALVRVRLGERKAAAEDADVSLKIKLSPIGQIAKSIALAGDGKQEAALDGFDLAFRDCNSSDNKLLLVIKSILVFVCNKRKQAISRLRDLLTADDETTGGYYFQVLANMYLKQGDYTDAVQTLGLAKNTFTTQDRGPLMTISIIFNWNFENLELIAWERLCETLYTSGSIKGLGETLLKMAGHLAEDKKEATHGQIVQKIITHSREVTLLAWTGKSSTCNSCLPSTPAVYDRTGSTLVLLEGDELEKRLADLRTIFPVAEALVMHSWITRCQPVRFTNFRLLLPCIVFRVKRLRGGQGNVYYAETAVLGDVEITTEDPLPLKEARRLVVVNPWIHLLRKACGNVIWEGDNSDSDVESNMGEEEGVEADTELVHGPIIEEAPTVPADTDLYTRALRMIACLGQPFSALLLLKQPDGEYKRVAADHEIIVRGMGNNVPRDIRVEVLEVV